MSSEVAVEMYGGRWKRYPAYRDSGVEWLGEVPEGWIVNKLRFHINVNPTKSEVQGLAPDTAISFVPMEAVGEYGGLCLDQTKSIENVIAGYTYFREDDVVVAKITPCFENGKGAVIKGLKNGIGFGTTELHVLRPSNNINCHFLFYLTISYTFRKLGESEMYGAAGQKRIPENFIKNLKHPIPPLPEQHTIAAFLDSETGRIDALIEKKERQIELLQEKRAALISHAVTKGLDPDVPMKDSGVEWLDEVPENWEIKRLKHVCLLIKDGTHQPPSRTSNGTPLLSVRNIVNGKFVNLPDDSLISEEDFNELQRSVEVKKNDILLAIVGATIGKVAIVDEMLPFAIQRSLAVLRPNINIAYYKYFSYFMRSSSFQQLLWKNVGYSAQPGIYLGSLANFNITVPDTNEQRAIASFIDRETGRIDTLTTKVRESVSKLREYRTALISAAVTGKIDVRNKET